MHFMLERRIERPPGYAERGCLLVSYRLPLLNHCHILCHEGAQADVPHAASLLAFTIAQAGELALREAGDREAFMLIQSGHTVRKRGNWHAHIFIIRRRWQKAWVYLILGAKNLGLAAASLFMPQLRNLQAYSRKR